MAECQLLAEEPRRHFMTRRFDRGPSGAKHHLLTLCGMAHLDFNMVGAHSYDQYLQTVAALGLSTDAMQQAFRRMVFNVMAVNHDDHTKNVAFLRRHGDRHDVPGYRRVVREVRAAVDAWPKFAEQADVPADAVDVIRSDIEMFRPG